MDKKTTAILVLLVLFVITGGGWFSSWLKPAGRIPYDNTYKWTEIFGGYEAYLDRRISYTTISGTSMVPTFKDGDVVLWVEVDNKAELESGDIIIYQPQPTVHRIIEVGAENGEYWFRTKGDGSGFEDPPVWEDDVQGLVIGVIYSAA